MMRLALTAVLILSLICACPGFAQQAPRPQRVKAQKPPADDALPATQPEEEPAPQTPPRSDLRRSRLSADADRAIRKAVKFLISRQNANGSWAVAEEREAFLTGTTALVALSLLSAGESHQSPPLVKAVKFLKATHPEKSSRAVYSVALRAAVYAQLPSASAGTELKRDLMWLQRAMIDGGDFKGLYGYQPADGKSHWADYSNSQYGVLGVWYGAMAGAEVPVGYWRAVEHGWRGKLLGGELGLSAGA